MRSLGQFTGSRLGKSHGNTEATFPNPGLFFFFWLWLLAQVSAIWILLPLSPDDGMLRFLHLKNKKMWRAWILRSQQRLRCAWLSLCQMLRKGRKQAETATRVQKTQIYSELYYKFSELPQIPLCHKESNFRYHCKQKYRLFSFHIPGCHKYVFCSGWGKAGRQSCFFFFGGRESFFIFMLKSCQDTYIFHSITSYFLFYLIVHWDFKTKSASLPNISVICTFHTGLL